MSLKIHCALALFIAFSSQVLHAQTIYKWVDRNGQVHYTQLTPEESIAPQVSTSTDQNGANGTLIPKTTPQSQTRNPKQITAFEASHSLLINKDSKPISTQKTPAVATKQPSKNTPVAAPVESSITVPQPEGFCAIAAHNLETFQAYSKGTYTGLKLVGTGTKEQILTKTQIEEQITLSKLGLETYCL